MIGTYSAASRCSASEMVTLSSPSDLSWTAHFRQTLSLYSIPPDGRTFNERVLKLTCFLSCITWSPLTI